MRGLLYKDLLQIWRDCKFMIFFSLFFIAIGVAKNAIFFYSFALFYVALFPFVTMGLDENSGWDKYALTMPVKRWHLVMSRYLLSILGLLVTLLVYLIFRFMSHVLFGLSWNIGSDVMSLTGIFLFIVFFASLSYPLVFKFGVARGRFLYVLVFGICFAMGYALTSVDAIDLEALITNISSLSVILLLAVAVIIFFTSLLLSVRIYERRDF